MFGLTLEKMIIIGIIAAVLIGPQRLPLYAQKLGELIRTFRAFAEASKTRAESELGVPLNTAEWNSQIRQYDPRRIVRDAWTATPQAAPPQAAAHAAGQDGEQDAVPDAVPADPAADGATESPDETETPAVETRVRWEVVGGTSGHPIRRRVVETVPVTVPVAETTAETPDAGTVDLSA
ncbi:MAG TPA: twin-arginine translocase TatA/TatE family subunit [Candidatus Corynebacterium avicola]|uniref:Twin-arginine translocase TatA/TatE family subunit n=1 Tax=Candidatus Corynebacterium avicola TaxID=2838527 RepID=A0A9D1RN63_9CORY|nr:twin-arginine translocase TatA/TatE family subunit [Candidatus Corynebacterium avicola]